MKQTRQRKSTPGPFDEVYARLRHGKNEVKPPAPSPRPEGAQNFGYFRVSTHRQAEEGYSLEAQKAAIAKYAADKGLGEVQFFVDPGTSASKVPLADRPAGGQLVQRVRPGDRVIIPKIDRGFRNFADFIHWHSAWTEMGVPLHIIDFIGSNMDSSTALGRLMVRQLALFAAWESECNSERVKAAFAHKKAQGYLFDDRAPKGFKARKLTKGHIAVPDPVARRLMGMVLQWYDEEQMTFKQIRDHLIEHRVPFLNRHQTTWNLMRVRDMVFAERALQAQEKGQVEA